ncbi:uncharacterized protein LOC135090678 isoform X2 [Scylla paramamosain]
MRLSVRLCAAVVAALGVVVAAEHVEPRKVRNTGRNFVSPRLPEESLPRFRNSHIFSDTRRRQRARQNIHSQQYTQEGLDERAAYRASQHLGGRYHSPRGQAETSNHHTVAAIRHESRVPQHVRINHTNSPTVRGFTHDPAPTSRTQTTGDESSRVHQMGLHTTHERRRHPYARDSYDPRVPSASRDRLQRLPPQQHAGINNRVSHSDARVDRTSLAAGIGEQVNSALLASSIRLERPPHYRHMAPTTQTRSNLTREPSSTLTSGLSRELDAAEEHPGTQHGFSETSDEVENYLQQLQDWPDKCCGSRVPFDPRTGIPTGAFQRVAAAGSLKVVHVPARGSFPPSEVRDLLATPLDPHTLSLTWTAPGGDLDSGTASGYIIRLSEARHDLQESQFDAAPEETLLETSEALTAAGVYQTAGTRVSVEVPLVRPLQRGHVYYVAFKALDNDGHSSRVSNVARFTVLRSSTTNNTAASNSVPPTHARIHTQIEEAPGTTTLRGSTRTNGEINTEAPLITPLTGSNTESEQQREPNREGISEDPSLRSVTPASVPEPSESEDSENQRKRKRDRKNKNKRRRNGRRRNDRQRERNSDTSYTQDPEKCEPLYSLPSQQEPVSLCQAHQSLALAIIYLTQNNEHHYLDYLSAALHSLEQKMQPSWRAETRPPHRQ